MVDNADLRIWLYAPISCRIKRIAFRDQVADEKTAMDLTLEREQCEADRYRSYYDINISDLSIYHIILNSERWGVEGLGAIIDTAIGRLEQSPS